MELTYKPLVLVLCTENSIFGPMAEALFRKHHGEKYEVRSAGLAPATEVHPLAIEVMDEIDIDLRSQRPRSVDDLLGKASVAHLIVLHDAHDDHPPHIWPGVVTRMWLKVNESLEGDEAQMLAQLRETRNKLDAALRKWSPDSPDIERRVSIADGVLNASSKPRQIENSRKLVPL